MSDELKRVGNTFRKRRQELNLTLKEIENSTSIRSSYLEAIEAGTIHDFIAGVYAIGFMKQYANFLEIDFESMVRETPHAFKITPEKHEFDYGIGTLEVRGSLGGGVRWFPNLLWALGVAAVLVAAWALSKYLGIL